MNFIEDYECSPQIKHEEISINNNSQVNSQEFNRSRTWNQNQLYLLAAFLRFNQDKFYTEKDKKRWKIFKLMSLFIKTRNINQCRSYTHKLLHTFKNIHLINNFFRKSLPNYMEVTSTFIQRNKHIFLSQCEYQMNKQTTKIPSKNSKTSKQVKNNQIFVKKEVSQQIIASNQKAQYQIEENIQNYNQSSKNQFFYLINQKQLLELIYYLNNYQIIMVPSMQ